ncbi:MAG: flippase-like domain-containing protein [Acidobacteria bacterium]|nr:flippase-like domain-containing protein [Acidobacteriota bacterium]
MKERVFRILARRGVAIAITCGIFAILIRRVPLDRLANVLATADYPAFLVLMLPNTVFYFCWDTLVLSVAMSWFHGPVAYSDLLPVRASSYVVAFFNTNAGRGALAAYLSRRLGAPFLQIGGTVLFLVLTEYTHLVAWATVGILMVRQQVRTELAWAPPMVAVFWLVFFVSRHWLSGAMREWTLLRTFRMAPPSRYVQIVLLRAPMFFVSLWVHYLAARSFGIEIPFGPMLAFLPVIFMLAALPITVAHLGTTQAAWIFFFGGYAPAEKLLAFSLAAHLTFTTTRTLLGLAFLPRAWADLISKSEVTSHKSEVRTSDV